MDLMKKWLDNEQYVNVSRSFDKIKYPLPKASIKRRIGTAL